MTFPLPKRKRLSPSHNRAKVQEKETAERFGGRQTKASGSSVEKGDVRITGVMRIENKTTKNKSFSVTTDHIGKIEQSVFGTSEIPTMCIELDSGKHRFWVVPNWAMEEIIFMLKEKNEFNK